MRVHLHNLFILYLQYKLTLYKAISEIRYSSFLRKSRASIHWENTLWTFSSKEVSIAPTFKISISFFLWLSRTRFDFSTFLCFLLLWVWRRLFLFLFFNCRHTNSLCCFLSNLLLFFNYRLVFLIWILILLFLILILFSFCWLSICLTLMIAVLLISLF